jgi:hypothetical protein
MLFSNLNPMKFIFMKSLYVYKVNKQIRNNNSVHKSKTIKFKRNRSFINIKDYMELATVYFGNITLLFSDV